MKNNIKILMLLGMMCILLISCTEKNMRLNLEEVNRVEIINGNNGELIILNSEQRDIVINNFKELDFNKSKFQEESDGFSYSIKFLNDDKELYNMAIKGDREIYYDGYNYNTVDKTIDDEYLESLYK